MCLFYLYMNPLTRYQYHIQLIQQRNSWCAVIIPPIIKNNCSYLLVWFSYYPTGTLPVSPIDYNTVLIFAVCMY